MLACYNHYAALQMNAASSVINAAKSYEVIYAFIVTRLCNK